LDYTNSTCPKLLLEPQRTNISGFEEAGTGNYTTATVTSGTSILGLTTFRVTSNYSLGDAPHIINASAYQSGTTYTASSYVNLAATDGTEFQISMFGFGSPSGAAAATMNVSTKAVTVTATAGAWTGATGKATLISGNIYRLEVTAMAAQTLVGSRLYCAVPADNKYVEVAGIQIEAGAYATSFINKPSTAAVTRVAESASKTGIASLIGQTEGTLFVEFQNDANSNSAIDRIISISDGTTSNRLYIAKTSAGASSFVAVSGGTQTGSITGSAFPTGNVKIAVAYKTNDCIIYINGVAAGTDTSVTIPACSQLFLGRENNVTTDGLFKPYKQALVFKTRLPNSDLATLTSL
jgi:hypothetical protein